MNNKNKILVGCLALLLVLSVGYALFSETITINGTATAKGSFDISAECGEVISQGGTGTCTIEDGIIKTSSTLSKPNDSVVFQVAITNNGTIGAKLKTVDSSNNYHMQPLTLGGDEVYYNPTYEIIAAYGIQDRMSFGVSDSYLEGLGLILEPNQTEILIINHGWRNVENQPTVPEEGVTMNYNMTLGFEQITAN